MKTNRYICYFLLFLVAISTPSAYSQIEEVLVTAQKREESIQSIGLSVQALSHEEIKKRGIAHASDILDQFANVSRNSANRVNAGYTIRGVGTNNFHGNVNRAVAVYHDDVFFSNAYSGAMGVFDLERIEVLRGPQNTLFGRNAIGGAVNYIANTPQIGEGIQGYFDLSLGEYNYHKIEAAVGADNNENFAGRFSFSSTRRDGVFENQAPGRQGEKLGETEIDTARLQLLYEPNAASSINVKLHYGANGGKGISNKGLGKRDPDDPTLPCSTQLLADNINFESRIDCVTANGVNPSSDNWNDIYEVGPAKQDVDFSGGSIKFKHEYDAFDFLSISSYESTAVEFSEDLGGQDRVRMIAFQDSSFDQVTQEFRFTSTTDSRFRWISGIYIYFEDLEQGTSVRQRFITNDAQTTAFNLLDQKENDLSVYGQIDYDLTTALTFTAGARYTQNKKESDSLFAVVATPESNILADQFMSAELTESLIGDSPGTCPPPLGGVPCILDFQNLKQETDDWGWNFRLSYDLEKDKLLYTSLSRGFKSGGFDTRALAAFAGTANEPVKPEYLTSFETGFKSTFQNNLLFNTALFHYWWEDLQTFDTVDGVPAFINIPEVKIYGAEIELNWYPIENLLAQFSYGYLQSEITDTSGIDNADKGHVLQNSPENSATFLIEKTIPIESGKILLRADYRYIDDQIDSLRDDEDAYAFKESQQYFNAWAEYQLNSLELTLSAWGKNLTEEKTCHQILVSTLPGVISPQDRTTIIGCNPNDGVREFGVSTSYKF